MPSLEELLAEANEVQESTRTASKKSGFVNENVPDGDYRLLLVDAKLKPNEKKGLIVDLTWQVREAANPENEEAVGEQVGQGYFPLAKDTESPAYLKRDLEWFGFEGRQLSPELMKELVEAEIEIDGHVRVKDGYQNLFINDVVSSAAATSEGDAIAVGDKVLVEHDDDIHKGVVKVIDDDDDTADVYIKKLKETVTVSLDDLSPRS